MKKAPRTLFQLLAFLALLVGCGGGVDSIPASDSDAASVLYRGNGGDPGSLDPALAEDVHAFNILTDLYEGLVAESATGQLVPGVAESWTISGDGLVYTFTLRGNVRWSNGDRVTSLDFVNAFRRVANPDTASTYGFLLEPILNFAKVQNGSVSADQLGVTAVGDRILEIRLAQPAPQLLSVLAMPIAFPTHYSAVARRAFSNPDAFVGNGAYSLIAHNIGGLTRLRRNPMYWDAGSVGVKEVVYLPIVDPGTELNMYRAGELDITNTVPPEHVRLLQKERPDELRIAPSLALYYLAFDLSEPPFDNALLRQALTLAIDRQQLVSLIGRGEQPAFGIVPHGVAGHVGSEFGWRALSDEERLRRARALYQEAGYGKDAPLAVKYTYDAGDIHEKVALAVSSMWRETLGVEVTLDKREWQYFLQTRDRRTEWQIMRFAWFGDYNHVSTFTNIFRSGDPQNLPAYANPDYDRLLAAASAESDSSRRAAYMTQAESILLADHPIAPLYFFVSKHLVRPGIAGFENNVLDRHHSKYLFLEQKP
ncbi:MAG: peptide ABC transporter substrate-binding protein [Gammaproteobacteria bacterium]|nr:peptide ABC transporter substrate-binding protein [Gammaproteobacteria bacterium]